MSRWFFRFFRGRLTSGLTGGVGGFFVRCSFASEREALAHELILPYFFCCHSIIRANDKDERKSPGFSE